MKIEKRLVSKLVITESEHVHSSYGAINVYLEDYGLSEEGYQSGKVVIECDGESWVHYWSSMGCSLIEFFSGASVSYLVSKLLSPDQWFELDSEKLIHELKSKLFKKRRDKRLTDWDARELFENIETIGRVTQEELFAHYSDTCEKLFGDEWFHNLPKKNSAQYNHVEKIVKAMKDGIKGIQE